MPTLLGSYQNGNYTTEIYSDGTKIRTTEDDEFRASFAENIDVKITDYCDAGCPMCHEGSSIDGLHGDIMNQKWIHTLHPYQEVAIGGGDCTSHPQLIPFLETLKENNVIANITVNQKHFMKRIDLIEELVDRNLVWGVGVSLMDASDINFIKTVQQYPNTVIHTIAGMLTAKDIARLENRNLKLLILGYKKLRRGEKFYESESVFIDNKIRWLSKTIPFLTESFNIISFDNLAIEQLNVKQYLSDDEWDTFYMGDEGTSTFYIDAVSHQFAQNSTAPFANRMSIDNKSVDDMFKIINGEAI